MKIDTKQIASEMRRTARVMREAGHPEIADGNDQIADYIDRLERELAEARAEIKCHGDDLDVAGATIKQAQSDLAQARAELEAVRKREQGTLAQRIRSAYTEYGQLEWDLFEAIEKIVGENNVEDTHVECDSVYDSSVEVVMAEGKELTKEHREKILALGFARIWCDGRYRRSEATAAAKGLAARLSRLEAVVRDDVAALEYVADYLDGFSNGEGHIENAIANLRTRALSALSALAAALGEAG